MNAVQRIATEIEIRQEKLRILRSAVLMQSDTAFDDPYTEEEFERITLRGTQNLIL